MGLQEGGDRWRGGGLRGVAGGSGRDRKKGKPILK